MVFDDILPAAVNQHVSIIRVDKSKCLPGYLLAYLCLPQIKEYIASFNAGGSRRAVTKGHIESFEVPIAPMHVQKYIQKTTYDFINKIELNRQTNQTLEQVAQAIFKSWFVDFEPVKAKAQVRASVAQGKLPGSEQPLPKNFDVEIAVELAAMCDVSGKTEEQLKSLNEATLQQLKNTAALFPNGLVESKLGVIPEGWVNSALADFASFQNGYAFKSKDWKERGIPVVKIGSVKPGLVDLNNISYVSEDTVTNLDRFQLQPGDLLVGMSGYPGVTGIVPIATVQPYLNQRVGRIKPLEVNEEYYSWLYCLLRDSEFKKYAESRAHGSAQANISGKMLMEYEVIFSSRDLLSALNNILLPMIMKYLRLSSENENLTNLRDELLPKLFSGRLRA